MSAAPVEHELAVLDKLRRVSDARVDLFINKFHLSTAKTRLTKVEDALSADSLADAYRKTECNLVKLDPAQEDAAFEALELEADALKSQVTAAQKEHEEITARLKLLA